MVNEYAQFECDPVSFGSGLDDLNQGHLNHDLNQMIFILYKKSIDFNYVNLCFMQQCLIYLKFYLIEPLEFYCLIIVV